MSPRPSPQAEAPASPRVASVETATAALGEGHRLVDLDALTADQREAVGAVLVGDLDEIAKQLPDDVLGLEAATRGLAFVAPADPLGPADVPVHVAFARVMSEIGAIPKTHEHKAPGSTFMFRGIEDVQGALYPILVRHGSFLLPDAVLERRELTGRQTNDGKPYTAAAVHMRFRFYGPRGDSLTFEAWGEGQDRSDKATGKAHSMAYKTAVLEAFSIPTGDQPDADRSEPDDTPEERAARVEALGRAAQAIRDADTLPKLDAIAGEAARRNLLRMTVDPEGVTLQVLGEARYADLRAAQAPPAEGGEPS